MNVCILTVLAASSEELITRENLPEVWDKEVWPPSSPDFRLLDYFVLGVFEF